MQPSTTRTSVEHLDTHARCRLNGWNVSCRWYPEIHGSAQAAESKDYDW